MNTDIATPFTNCARPFPRCNPLGVLSVVGIVFGMLFVLSPPLYFWSVALLVMLLLMIAVSPLATLCLTIFLLAVESFNLCILFKGLYEVRIFPYMLTGLLAMIACFIQRTRCRQAFDGTPLTKIFLMVVVLEAISILWSPVPGIGVYLSLLLGVHLLMLIAIVNIMNSKKAVQTVVLTWIWGAAVVSVCVFVSRWVEVRWEWTLTDVVFLRAGMGKQAFRPAGVGGAINIGGYLATSLMIVMGEDVAAAGALLCIVPADAMQLDPDVF